MPDLALSNQALESYEALEHDQRRWPTLDKVEEALAAIADEPGSRDHRLRRFQDPPCFVVPVVTPEGDWVVLWRQVTEDDEFPNLVAGDVYVLYLGALPT